MDTGVAREPEPEASKWGRRVRLGLAGLVALGLLGFVTGSGHWRGIQSCGEVLQTGQTQPVTVCTPIAATGAPVLVGVILIVLLLLPDFAEVAIPGLLSLKRKVEQQERRQDALESRIQNVVSQSTTTHFNQHFVPFVADPSAFEERSRRVDALEGARDDALAIEQGRGPEDDEEEESDEVSAAEEPKLEPDVQPSAPSSRQDEEDSALLAQELIRRWEDLSRAAAQAESLALRQDAQVVSASGPTFSVTPSEVRLIDWWRTFREELEYVHAARNSVAHARAIDTETLRQAVELATKLQAALPDFAIYSEVDLRYMSLQFERRLQDWIRGQGLSDIPVDARTRRRFDVLGRTPDGQTVIAEAKIARRKITRATLVSWVAQLMDNARDFPDARLILAISGPGLVPSAQRFAVEGPVEVYIERRPGEFEQAS
jgi:hypothetical protein